MNKQLLLIRFFDDGGAEWGRFGEDGECLQGPQAGLPAASDVGEGRVVVLAPGEAVLLTDAAVPTRNPSKLRRALPFAVEARLVGDVTAQHVVPGRPDADGRVPAAVVARQRLEAWMDRLQEAGLEPDALYPEPLALPGEAESDTVLLERGRAVVRTGTRAGFACEADLLPVLVPSWNTAALTVYRTPDAAGIVDGARDARELDIPALCLLAKGVDSAGLDLLQGEYRPRRRARSGRRLWAAAAALALAWGVLELGLLTADYFRLRAANDAVDARIESVFRETFPDQPVRDPTAQMRQQLALRGARDAAALDLLRTLAPVLDRAVNIRLESLEYREGRLLVGVHANDIAALDALRNAVSASGPYRVELASASATESGVDGRLAISGAGA